MIDAVVAAFVFLLFLLWAIGFSLEVLKPWRQKPEPEVTTPTVPRVSVLAYSMRLNIDRTVGYAVMQVDQSDGTSHLGVRLWIGFPGARVPVMNVGILVSPR